MVAVGLSKIIVVTVNVIFMIFGLALLIIGIVFKVGWDDVRKAFDDEATKVDFDLQAAGDAAGVSAIVFGCIILLIALLGCAGACCDNKCMIGTYGVIVLVVVIGQIAVVALVAVKGKDAEDNLEKALVDTLKGYNETSSDDRSKSWSAIFHSGKCCGVTNYTKDFNSLHLDVTLRKEAGITGRTIPITCCTGFDYEDTLTKKIFGDKKACLNSPTRANAYTKGCYNVIKDWINDNKAVVIGVGVAVLLFELLLSAIAFFLCCRQSDD